MDALFLIWFGGALVAGLGWCSYRIYTADRITFEQTYHDTADDLAQTLAIIFFSFFWWIVAPVAAVAYLGWLSSKVLRRMVRSLPGSARQRNRLG